MERTVTRAVLDFDPCSEGGHLTKRDSFWCWCWLKAFNVLSDPSSRQAFPVSSVRQSQVNGMFPFIEIVPVKFCVVSKIPSAWTPKAKNPRRMSPTGFKATP